MLAIAILIGLALWVLITLVAIVIGVKIAGLKGAFAGFMLTMGGWFVYWAGEYVYIQHKVTQLCESEGGITVYVTPEQWRKQIGEAEWEKQLYQGNFIAKNQRNNPLIFENKEFQPMFHITDRISVAYGRNSYIKSIHQTDELYYENLSNKVLFRKYSINVQTYGLDSSLSALKFWMDFIRGCPEKKSYEFQEQYYQAIN